MKADYEQIDQLVAKEQIMAAKGDELDLLVAEYIMGYWWEDGPKYDYDGTCEWERILVPPSLTEDDFKSWVFPPKGKIDKSYFISKKWSSDIEAAWDIVEKANQMPWRIQRSYKGRWQVGRLGYCVAWCEENSCEDKDKVCSWCECGKVVWAETAPEAICRAALLAVLEVET